MQVMRYCRPASLAEAIAHRLRLGEKGVPLAGGTDLMLKLPRPFEGTLIDLSAAGIGGIEAGDSQLQIGAMVTAGEISRNRLCLDKTPLLARASLEASAVLAGPAGRRRLPVLALGLAPGKSACAVDELLVGFEVPFQFGPGSFQKLGLRDAQAIAVALVAAVASIDGEGRVERLAVVCGSVAPRIVRAASVERSLTGMRPSAGRIDEASRLVRQEISPISDIRGSAAYRREATVGLVRRALMEILPCS